MVIKKTLVIGASTNPSCYSFLAIQLLRKHGHEVVALGLKPGKVADVEIITTPELFSEIDTVTMYIGPQNQHVYYNYIQNLHPKRVIFNPGTENPVFEQSLAKTGIKVEEACTLVLLSTAQF